MPIASARRGGRPAAPLVGGKLSAEVFRDVSERLAARGLSRVAIEVTGAAEPLLRLAALEAERPRAPAAELRTLHPRQAVTDRIMLAMLDVSGTPAAIDREGRRGDAMLDLLEAASTALMRRNLLIPLERPASTRAPPVPAPTGTGRP